MSVRKPDLDPDPLPCTLCLVSVNDNAHCEPGCATRQDMTCLIYLCHDSISAHHKPWKAIMSGGHGPGDTEHMADYDIVLGLP